MNLPGHRPDPPPGEDDEPICPRPDKVAYRSRAKARRALFRSWQFRARYKIFDRAKPMGYYQCQCGAWHLTKQEQRKGHGNG